MKQDLIHSISGKLNSAQAMQVHSDCLSHYVTLLQPPSIIPYNMSSLDIVDIISPRYLIKLIVTASKTLEGSAIQCQNTSPSPHPFPVAKLHCCAMVQWKSPAGDGGMEWTKTATLQKEKDCFNPAQVT